MTLVKERVNLNNTQKKRITSFLNSKNPNVNLKLTKSSLSGPHELLVTKSQSNRLNKARQNGTGCMLKLSQSCLKQNQKGGFVEALGSLVTEVGIDSIKKSLASDSKGKRKIRSQLERLRGNGLNDKAFQKGVEAAKQLGQTGSGMDNKELLKYYNQAIIDNQIGVGFLSDFWDGFTFALSDPIGAVELGVRQLDKEISGNGVQEGRLQGGGIQFF